MTNRELYWLMLVCAVLDALGAVAYALRGDPRCVFSAGVGLFCWGLATFYKRRSDEKRD